MVLGNHVVGLCSRILVSIGSKIEIYTDTRYDGIDDQRGFTRYKAHLLCPATMPPLAA